MLSVLFIGKVVRAPEQRHDRNGKLITTAGMDLVDAEGATILVSVIAFSPGAVAALARLELNDEAAIVGHASLSSWTDDEGHKCSGLNVKASRVMAIDEAGPHYTPQERRNRLGSVPRGAVGG